MSCHDNSTGSRLDRALQREDWFAEQDRVTPREPLRTMVTCPLCNGAGAVPVNDDNLACPICDELGVCLEETAQTFIRARGSLT